MYIQLTIQHAQLTRDVETKMDPYVKITYTGGMAKTQAKKSADRNPAWNESFTVPAQGQIKIEVKDKNLLKDKIIGETYIQSQDLIGRQGPLTLPLTFQGMPAGQLFVLISGSQGGQIPHTGFAQPGQLPPQARY